MNPFERWTLWGSTTVVAVSGFVFLWIKYFVVPQDPYAIVNHPWQPFFLKLHILSAPVLVFAVGVVFLRHIWRQLRSGRPGGRRTGVTILLVLVPMVATGYLLQTLASREALRWTAWVHIATGAAYVLAVAGHQARTLAVQAAARRAVARAVAEDQPAA
jgi:cytochrome b subunit of formate dehydrogenase